MTRVLIENMFPSLCVCVCVRVCVCVSILDSHLLMALSKGEGGACVYIRGARQAFYGNTIHCEGSENLTQRQKRVKVKRRAAERGTHGEGKIRRKEGDERWINKVKLH